MKEKGITENDGGDQDQKLWELQWQTVNIEPWQCQNSTKRNTLKLRNGVKKWEQTEFSVSQ